MSGLRQTLGTWKATDMLRDQGFVCRGMLLGTWLVLGSLSGCQQQTPPPGPEASATAANGDKSAAEGKAAADNGRGLKVRPNVNSFPGRWGLVLTQALPDQSGKPAFRDLCLSLIEFVKDDQQQVTGKVIASLPNVPPTEISKVMVDGPRVQFDFQWGEQQGDYQGTLVDGVVRGALHLTTAGVLPVMLRPTEETTFEGWDAAPLAAGRELFSQAASQKEQPESLLAAAKEMRGSPLSLQAFDGIVSQFRSFPDLDEAALRKIYQDSLDAAAPWGPRLVARAKYKAAIGATIARRVPKLALEWLTAVEEGPVELLQADQRESLKYAREQAEVDLAMLEMQSQDAAVQQRAYEQLQSFLPSQRYNAEVLNVLAQYAVKQGQTDLAIEYLADILALPLLEQSLQEAKSGQPPGDPTAREQLLALYEKREGSTEGFEAFIRETYDRRLEELSAKIRSETRPLIEPADRQRVVLVELMTGGMCPPCIASDVALDMIQRDYGHDVAMVTYHQHNPGPDPLTNADSEERFVYYEAPGTPTAWIDGMVPPPNVNLGGPLQLVESVYNAFRGMVDYQVRVPMIGQLDLQAEVVNGQLSVTATATDLPAADLANLRLRLAIVEDTIDLTMPNGIRSHHSVLREMLGGAKGTAAKDGKLEYSLQMPLSDIEAHLAEYLQQFEVGRNLEFPVKPTKTGPLSLIGWVQNETNHLVLVTAKLPISGTDDPAHPRSMPPARSTVAPATAAPEPPVSALTPGNAVQE